MTIITVGVKKLKDNLSSYLKEAHSGTVVLITDRDRVIAELHEPVLNIRGLAEPSLQAEWIREGKLIPPKSEKTSCTASPLHSKEGTSARLIDLDRGE